MIRHQFGQVEFASEQWFRLAASTLAGATHAAGLATPAKPRSCRVRRVDIVANGTRNASLVLVLAEGPVKQVLITSRAVEQPSWTTSRAWSTPSSRAARLARWQIGLCSWPAIRTCRR